MSVNITLDNIGSISRLLRATYLAVRVPEIKSRRQWKCQFWQWRSCSSKKDFKAHTEIYCIRCIKHGSLCVSLHLVNSAVCNNKMHKSVKDIQQFTQKIMFSQYKFSQLKLYWTEKWFFCSYKHNQPVNPRHMLLIQQLLLIELTSLTLSLFIGGNWLW